MNKATEQILLDAWDYCNKEDKSTEFMIQYMQDVADVDFDTVIEFLTTSKFTKERGKK